MLILGVIDEKMIFRGCEAKILLACCIFCTEKVIDSFIKEIGLDILQGPLNKYRPGDNQAQVGNLPKWPRPFAPGPKILFSLLKVVETIPIQENVRNGHIYI